MEPSDGPPERSGPLRVHLAPRLDRRRRESLEARFGERIRLTGGSKPEGKADYEVLVTGRPTPELLDASEALTTLVVPWAGIPKPAVPLLRQRPHLCVHNLHHNAAATAELAIGLLLAVAKNVLVYDRELRANDWTNRGNLERSLQLRGRRATILGYGAIGRRIAAACRSLGMTVTGVSRLGPSGHPDAPDPVLPAADLNRALDGTDVLFVCCPATPETEGVIGAPQLARLPEDAVLVNVARGSVVDEGDLYDALRRRRLFGAGLDVWYRYPTCTAEEGRTPPSRFDFHELPNVVMSPHRAGHVRETEEERSRALAETLQAILDGREPPHRVDVEAGY